MSFLDEVSAAADDFFDKRASDIHDTIAESVKQSIQFGDPRTGALGQPVGVTGNLRNSWMRERVPGAEPIVSIVSTNIEYAPPIEDGVGPHGPMQVRSSTGGFHSVAQTIAGFPALVAAAVEAHS